MEMEEEKKIERLYMLLESDVDAETKSALRWAIFQLEQMEA